MMQDLNKEIERVNSKDTLVAFINMMTDDYSDKWQNTDLRSFLEALSGWIEDMEGYYKNNGMEVPQNINWRFMGEALLAAKTYE